MASPDYEALAHAVCDELVGTRIGQLLAILPRWEQRGTLHSDLKQIGIEEVLSAIRAYRLMVTVIPEWLIEAGMPQQLPASFAILAALEDEQRRRWGGHKPRPKGAIWSA